MEIKSQLSKSQFPKTPESAVVFKLERAEEIAFIVVLRELKHPALRKQCDCQFRITSCRHAIYPLTKQFGRDNKMQVLLRLVFTTIILKTDESVSISLTTQELVRSSKQKFPNITEILPSSFVTHLFGKTSQFVYRRKILCLFTFRNHPFLLVAN